MMTRGTRELTRVPHFRVPGRGDDQEVRVLSGPGRRDRSEAQGVNREVSTEGSV